MYIKGIFLKYLIFLSTCKWTDKLALYKCIHIFIIGNQLTTQNNDRYCPETLTGTAFSIKICSNHNMANCSPTGNNSCQCVSVLT